MKHSLGGAVIAFTYEGVPCLKIWPLLLFLLLTHSTEV